jgi:hypothetical protein
MDRDVKTRPPVLMAWGRGLLNKDYAFGGLNPKRLPGDDLLDHPLYFCTQTDQVLDEQRVAAIDVENVVNLGVAIGDQPS